MRARSISYASRTLIGVTSKPARRTLGGSEIQLVTIRRLHPKGAGPNWKVTDIIPQPTAPVSEVVRAALAHLPDAYHLEEE
jgi:hypothetical protein